MSLEIKPLDRLLEKIGVGVEFRPVGPDEFFRLDHGVKGLRRLETHRLEVETFEDVEDLQRRPCPGPLPGNSVHVVTTIIHADGFDPFGMVPGEVGLTQITAVGLHESVDLVGDLAVVKTVAPLLGDDASACARGAGFLNTSPSSGAGAKVVCATLLNHIRFLPRAGQALEGASGYVPSNTRWSA